MNETEESNNLVIQLFEGKKVRIAWDVEQEKYYFAVSDIVQVLTGTVNPRDYIKKMLRRDPELKSMWGTICHPVKMLAPDGKRRKTQAADLEGIFRIIQSIPSKKAEPVRQWLADVATTEYSKQSNLQTMSESQCIAKEGGDMARDARQTMEHRLGRSVVSPFEPYASYSYDDSSSCICCEPCASYTIFVHKNNTRNGKKTQRFKSQPERE